MEYIKITRKMFEQIRDADISTKGVAVLFALSSSVTTFNSTIANISLHKIAKLAKIKSRQTIRLAILELIRAGIIKVKNIPGFTNFYDFQGLINTYTSIQGPVSKIDRSTPTKILGGSETGSIYSKNMVLKKNTKTTTSRSSFSEPSISKTTRTLAMEYTNFLKKHNIREIHNPSAYAYRIATNIETENGLEGLKIEFQTLKDSVEAKISKERNKSLKRETIASQWKQKPQETTIETDFGKAIWPNLTSAEQTQLRSSAQIEFNFGVNVPIPDVVMMSSMARLYKANELNKPVCEHQTAEPVLV